MRHANCATARLTPAATPTSRKRRKSLSRMPPRPALRAAVTPNTRCCPHGELKLHAETRQALDALDIKVCTPGFFEQICCRVLARLQKTFPFGFTSLRHINDVYLLMTDICCEVFRHSNQSYCRIAKLCRGFC
ncbi:hypothetical protein AV530_004473 [Patagioenas fasciata monilis]|uniref:Uncharacterized protein n=1 Tax=Patagioenas fasciata monilis TaxID=372326 RepID=A0A1V4JCS8_PATFA|nr:hypothetical protein AV530_004473 [Patagioenas fasciata monilis]